MTKIASLQAIAAALLACGLFAAPAEAGPNRTFVSGLGTDSGACTRVAPCKTFAFAFGQTNAGGEIDVLDPAGYGAVTITKAISIVNDGVGVAAIGISSGNAITINAGATDSVHLRGLTIAGLGTGANGILFTTGGNLEIENCVVRGFVGDGIKISPTTPSSFTVSNTIASDNLDDGILVAPFGPAAVTGVLSKVTANNNKFAGIFVNGTVTLASLNVTIVDSVASNNFNFGVDQGGPLAVLRIAHSVVTGNGIGVDQSLGHTGTIYSYGDNDIDGNTDDNTGFLTPLARH